MTQLSKNFTLAELCVSQTAARRGLDNTPPESVRKNLDKLCDYVLQPLRDKLGKPIVVTSGYRSPAVNAAIGGARNSAHMSGLAADIHVPGMTTAALMKKIKELKLPVDQVIDEFDNWVHVAVAEQTTAPRNEYLVARYTSGGVTYSTARV